MRVKHKGRGDVVIAVKLNPHAVSPMEAIFLGEDGDMWTDYVMDYEPADSKLTHQDLVNWLISEEKIRLG